MKQRHGLKTYLVFTSVLAQAGLLAAAPSEFSVVGSMDGSDMQLQTSVTTENVTGPVREIVNFETPLPPGSLLVRTRSRKLYFILKDGQAISYIVGVGREGFSWSGSNRISRKAEWPDWRPPPQMIAREAAAGHILPTLVRGGPKNPLGARAIYIGDTDFRIHGTDKPWSIGHAVSSGCIRMLNENVTELYDLVQVGARIVVE